MKFESGQNVLQDLKNIIKSGDYYHYDKCNPDKEIKGLTWDIFGTWHNNVDQLYVRACYNGKTWAIRSTPSCLFPRLIDRMFGIDAGDQQVANNMSNELFREIKEHVSPTTF